MGFYKAYATHDKMTPIGRWIINGKTNSIVKALSNQIDLTDKKIIEVGPGRGLLATRLAEKGAKMTLVEPSAYMQDIMREKGFTDFKDYFVPPFEEKDESYDVVIMQNVFEHLHNHDNAVLAMEEIRRILKPGGMFVVNTPEALHWGPYFWDGDYTHNYVTTRSRFEQMFIDHGFAERVKRLYAGPLHGFWTPIVAWLMRGMFFVDFIGNTRIRKKLNKFRFGLLTEIFFIVEKQDE